MIAEYNALTSTIAKRYAWGIDFSGTTQKESQSQGRFLGRDPTEEKGG